MPSTVTNETRTATSTIESVLHEHLAYYKARRRVLARICDALRPLQGKTETTAKLPQEAKDAADALPDPPRGVSSDIPQYRSKARDQRVARIDIRPLQTEIDALEEYIHAIDDLLASPIIEDVQSDLSIVEEYRQAASAANARATATVRSMSERKQHHRQLAHAMNQVLERAPRERRESAGND